MQARNIQKSATYETSDTPLVTWLMINGIRKIGTNSKVKPAIFILDNADFNRINDLIFAWDSGNAIANCAVFYKTYRLNIHSIKEA